MKHVIDKNAHEVYEYLREVAAFLNRNTPIHPDALRIAGEETFSAGVNRILANLKTERLERTLKV